MKYIEKVEFEINKAYNKIHSGDRSELLQGTLFKHLSFTNLSSEERKQLRHHLHKTISSWEEKMEDSNLRKEGLCQIMLRDCMLEKIPKTTKISLEKIEEMSRG